MKSKRASESRKAAKRLRVVLERTIEQADREALELAISLLDARAHDGDCD